MNPAITLSVRFPKFDSNYYAQPFEPRKELTLIFDEKFEDLLMPAADHHFNNEVVGLNDQFRFLNDVLSEHLMALEHAQAASQRPFTF